MTNYKIKIYSKKKNSLNFFLKFLERLQHYQLIFSFSRKKAKRKRITVLKSPHVNKKAQEQYQVITYFNKILYITWDKKKGTVFLKKIKDTLFPGLRISIDRFQSKNKKKLFIQNSLLNPLKFVKSKTIFLSTDSQQNNKLFSKTNALKKKKIQKKVLVNLKKLENCTY